MMFVSDAIKRGIQDYEACQACCPFRSDDPLLVEGFHGTKPIGKVRVGIDWERMWQIGWEIGELMEKKRVPSGSN